MPWVVSMDKTKIQITEEESAAIGRAMAGGSKFVIVKGNMITISSISGIYKDEVMEDKNVGRLHDGTRVIKRFGQWVDARDPDLKLSHSYYPELATDTVMTEEAYARNKAAIHKELGTGSTEAGGKPLLSGV